MAKQKVKEAEVVEPTSPIKGPLLISVLVLMVSLVNSICGDTPPNGVLNTVDGKKVIAFIEETVKKTFPDVAPMIIGMFGMELLQIMPVLKDPEKVVKDMVKMYAKQAEDVNPSN